MSIIHDALKKAQSSRKEERPTTAEGGGTSRVRKSATAGLVVVAVIVGSLTLTLVFHRAYRSMRSSGNAPVKPVSATISIAGQPTKMVIPTASPRVEPSSVDVLMRQGQRYYWLGDLQMAEKTFREALLQETGNDSEVSNNIGLVLKKQGKLDEALEFYSRILRNNPDIVVTLNNRAVVYRRLKQYNNAFADLERALEIDPGYAHAQFNMATVYEATGNAKAAVLFYRKYLNNSSRTPGLDEALTKHRISVLEARISSVSWPAVRGNKER
jgi:tetratricopeptide (TPR) repeat protein